jgi:hypothetical protein
VRRAFFNKEHEHINAPDPPPPPPGAPRLSEVEPVAVRLVEVVVGAEVWVAKAAVEVVEVRWGDLPRPRLACVPRFRTRGRSRRERQPRPLLLSRQSARGRLARSTSRRGGCGFRGRRCPRRSKCASARCCRLALARPSSSIPTPLPWLSRST